SPRADMSGIVREAMAQFASAPVSEQVLTARPATGPVGVVLDPVSRPIAVPVARSDIGSRPLAAVAGLAPEAPRARRPKVAELIAMATETGSADSGGGLLGIEGIDEAKVDVGKVLARARALAAAAGIGELESELAG